MGDFMRYKDRLEALFSTLLEDILLLRKRLELIEEGLSSGRKPIHPSANSHFLPLSFLYKTEISLDDLILTIKSQEYDQGLTFPVILYSELLEAKSLLKSLKKQLLRQVTRSDTKGSSLSDTSLYPLKTTHRMTSGVTRHSTSLSLPQDNSSFTSPLSSISSSDTDDFPVHFFSSDTSDVSRHPWCHLQVYRLKSDVTRHSTNGKPHTEKRPLPSENQFFQALFEQKKSDFIEDKTEKLLPLEVYDLKTTRVDRAITKGTESDRLMSVKDQHLPASPKYLSPHQMQGSESRVQLTQHRPPLMAYSLDPSLSTPSGTPRVGEKTPLIENQHPFKSEDKPLQHPPFTPLIVKKAPLMNTDGLNRTERELLSILYNSQKPLTYEELAKALRLNYSTVKNKVWFLNKKGYVISSLLNERREKEFFLEESMRIKVSGR